MLVNGKLNLNSAVSSLKYKNIIFVFGNLELGGAERQGLLLARWLKEVCGANVQVWGLREAPGRLSQLCDESGIPWQGITLPWKWGYRNIVQNFCELWRVAVLLRHCKPDLLLPYTFFPNIICGLVWRFTGAKLCVWNQRDEGFFLERAFWRSLAVHLTPYFISNSVQGREALLKAFTICPEKVVVIHNGFSLERAQTGRREWRARLGLSNESFVACMVANIHAHKDHATLLKGWRHFLNDVVPAGTSPVLLLAGRDDEGGDRLKGLVGSLGLVDNVIFAGGVDDVAGLLAAADLCVHSSKSEGLPNAVLEAMAAGLPIVATDIPGIREAVGPEGYRFLVPHGDARGLADRIGELFREPSLRASLGEIMRQRVHEKFDPSLMQGRTVSFIAEHWPNR